MSFLSPSEFNILMDQPNLGANPYKPEWVERPIPLDDLKRFRDAGVSTVLEFMPWHLIEPARGVYDWSFADEQVDRCHAAGLKVLMMPSITVIRWAPDEWYVWDKRGRPMRAALPPPHLTQSWGCLSPWNDEAMDYQIGYIRRACERYNSDEVMLMQCFSQNGEAILPPAIPCVYDPAAVKSYRAYAGDARGAPNVYDRQTQAWLRDTLLPVILAQQAVYATHPERELWAAWHPVYWNWPPSGVTDIAGYWETINDALRPRAMYHIFFCYFDNGFDGYIEPLAQQLIGQGVQVVVGGEWCDGLKHNTPRAIAQGLRALITAPIHAYLQVDKVEPWMVGAVRESVEMFRESSYVRVTC